MENMKIGGSTKMVRGLGLMGPLQSKDENLYTH